MPDASGAARAGVTLRVPTDYCFGLDNKPGIETLVLAITEREEDARKMRDLLAASRSPAAVDVRRPARARRTSTLFGTRSHRGSGLAAAI